MCLISLIGAIVACSVHPDPLFLYKPRKIKNMRLIVEYAEANQHDPYELLAIAITESNLNPNAISNKGAVGLFQVMCKYWYKPLHYASIQECNAKLRTPRLNIKAGGYVLSRIRNHYPQCRGDLAYRCYFAGHGWRKFGPKTQASILRYERKIKERKNILHSYYKKLIEKRRSKIRKRS